MKYSMALLFVLAAACSSQKSPDTISTAKTVPKKDASESDTKYDSATASVNGSDEGVTPPANISGAYMTGKIFPSPVDGSITVGVVGMKGTLRMSSDTGRYTTTWTVDLDQPLAQDVKLYKSNDPDYDQILEFVGTQDQLNTAMAAIEITLQFRENQDGVISNNLVVSKLTDLVKTN